MSATTTSMASMRGVMRTNGTERRTPGLGRIGHARIVSPVDFGVLGPLRVVEAGEVVDIGSPTQRIVLATLIAHLGQVVPIDVLAEAVWEDTPPASALNTLRSQISRLRRVVGGRLEGSAAGYSLVLAPGDTVDAATFDHALRASRDGGDVAELVAALAAWRGRAYGELADTAGVRVEARRLELARLDATELVAAADLAAGRYTESAAACEAVVAADDVREPSWAILVRALARAGRPAEALRAIAASGHGPARRRTRPRPRPAHGRARGAGRAGRRSGPDPRRHSPRRAAGAAHRDDRPGRRPARRRRRPRRGSTRDADRPRRRRQVPAGDGRRPRRCRRARARRARRRAGSCGRRAGHRLDDRHRARRAARRRAGDARRSGPARRADRPRQLRARPRPARRDRAPAPAQQ